MAQFEQREVSQIEIVCNKLFAEFDVKMLHLSYNRDKVNNLQITRQM